MFLREKGRLSVFMLELLLCRCSPTRYKELLEREAQLEERQREMDLQRQEMESEAQRRLESQRELERLKDGNDR